MSNGAGTRQGAIGAPRGASAIRTAVSTAVLTLAIAGGGAWYLGWLNFSGGRTAVTAPEGAPGGRKLLFYRNPMNPAITSPVPAKDEMGMDYIPVYADASGKAEKPKSIAEETADFFAEEGGGKVPGMSEVTLDAGGVALAGVQTVPALKETVRRTVRAVGRVVPDETRVQHVHTKVGGWVEKLHVNFAGQLIRRGEPLLDFYAPEILSTQEELLAALRFTAQLTAAGDRAGRASAEKLVVSARQRLLLYDVPQAVIDAIEREGAPRRTVTLSAPVSGFVTGKDIYEGQQVEPAMELYTVTDLSRIWVEADVYESEAGAVKLGAAATLTLSSDPGQRLEGHVSYVAPVLNEQSRTVKVRIEFANADLRLKPAMFGDVALVLDAATGVSIPDSAVIDSGTRQVVFVSLGEGRFAPRLVRIGVRGEGKAQVLSGVAEGERVVVKANFLLDSESRLRSLVEQAAAGAGN